MCVSNGLGAGLGWVLFLQNQFQSSWGYLRRMLGVCLVLNPSEFLVNASEMNRPRFGSRRTRDGRTSAIRHEEEDGDLSRIKLTIPSF